MLQLQNNRFQNLFSLTCACKGLPTLIKYRAIKWREQLVGNAWKELMFKLIFETTKLKLIKRTKCVWWSWIKERWMQRRGFFNVLSRPSWSLIFTIWPLPRTQKIFKDNNNTKSYSHIALCSLSEIADMQVVWRWTARNQPRIYHYFNIILLLFLFFFPTVG